MSIMNALQSVNRSTPQLVHAPSKQSVTASDDYYSVGSDVSSNGEGTAVLLSQFQTPPSHMQSRQASEEVLQSESTAPTIRHVRYQEPTTSPIQKPAAIHVDESQTIKRRPVSSEGTVVRRAVDPELSPPTPGVDDTPYIRFAIDQLTRDEELLGARRPETGSEASYPVHRPPPDESRGKHQHRDLASQQGRQSSDTVIRHPNVHCKSNVLSSKIAMLRCCRSKEHLSPDQTIG